MNDKTLSNDKELTYEELKEMCKKLCRICTRIFAMHYLHHNDSVRVRLAEFEKLGDIAGEGYNIDADATRKGLYA